MSSLRYISQKIYRPEYIREFILHKINHALVNDKFLQDLFDIFDEIDLFQKFDLLNYELGDDNLMNYLLIDNSLINNLFEEFN